MMQMAAIGLHATWPLVNSIAVAFQFVIKMISYLLYFIFANIYLHILS